MTVATNRAMQSCRVYIHTLLELPPLCITWHICSYLLDEALSLERWRYLIQGFGASRYFRTMLGRDSGKGGARFVRARTP